MCTDTFGDEGAEGFEDPFWCLRGPNNVERASDPQLFRRLNFTHMFLVYRAVDLQ